MKLNKLSLSKISIVITILAFTFSVSAQQLIKNPLSIFNILLSCPTEESMIKTCEQYGFKQQDPQSGYNVYSFEDETTVQFKMDSIGKNRWFPLIKITTPENKKYIEKLLKNLSFEKQKEKDTYLKGHKYGPTRQKVTLIKNKNKTFTLVCTKILNCCNSSKK